MKAVRVHQFGGPEVLQYEEVPTPTPGPGQVLVKLAAAGLNFSDVHQRTGHFPHKLPYTMGRAGSGPVAAVGPKVTSFTSDEPVAYTGVPGSYAEYALVPASVLCECPLVSMSKSVPRPYYRA